MKIVKNLGVLFLGALIGSLVLQVSDTLGEVKARAHVGYVNLDLLLTQHPKRAGYEKEMKAFIKRRKDDIQSKSTVPGLTDEQKKKIQLLQQKYEQEVMAKDRELSQEIYKDVVAKVKVVAKAKKMELVLQKSAVMYGGVDLTKEVLKQYKPKGK